MRFFNIKTKLFFVLVIVSIIPIIVVSYTSYNSFTKLVDDQTSLVASTTVQATVNGLEEILDNIDRISLTFLQQTSDVSVYSTVLDELRNLNNTDDQYENYLTRNRLKLLFENIMLSYNYVNGIYLFTPEGKSINYGIDLKAGYNPIEDFWFKSTIDERGELYISEVSKKLFILNAQPSLSVSRALYDPYTNELIGVFMIDLSIEAFNGIRRNATPSLNNIYLVDENNRVIYDKNELSVNQPLPLDIANVIPKNHGEFFQHNNGQILTVVQEIKNHDWKIIATIWIDTIHQQYGISQKLIMYISISCAIIFLILSFALSNLITEPIIKLTRTMRKNKIQQFVSLQENYHRNDEIGILYHEYNKMIQSIDLHVKEAYQNKILSLDSQMKALEAQINSHFLYNTLESINSIAELEEVESIVIMTKALGDMFRYSIKTDSELVTTLEELQHIKNYLAIQQIRYEEKISFFLAVDEELFQLRILKLILQPLVENAIYHGLENKRGKGNIHIQGYIENKSICFIIKDDGVGMTLEQISQLQALINAPPTFTSMGERSKQSIGIKNVHSRIQLYYGDEYGISVKSQLNIGTTIIVEIPYQKL